MIKKSYSTQDLEQAADTFKTEQIKELTDTREMRAVAHALLRQEARRLSAKLGETHPWVRALEAGLKKNLDTIHELDVELEVARIRIPQIDEDETLVQGRVTDKDGLGLQGLMVGFQDGKRSMGNAETDASGYFAVVLKPEVLEQAAKTELFLTVRLKTGRTLYRSTDPLALSPGKVVTVNVTLSRQKPATRTAGVSHGKFPEGKSAPKTPPTGEE